jgi:hypothetical protein
MVLEDGKSLMKAPADSEGFENGALFLHPPERGILCLSRA